MPPLFRMFCTLLGAAALIAALFDFYEFGHGSGTSSLRQQRDSFVLFSLHPSTPNWPPKPRTRAIDFSDFEASVAEAVNITVHSVKPATPNVENIMLTRHDFQKLLINQMQPPKHSGHVEPKRSLLGKPAPPSIEDLLEPIEDNAPHRQTYPLPDLEVAYVEKLVHSNTYRTSLMLRVDRGYFFTATQLSQRPHGQNKHADQRFFRDEVPLPVVQAVSLTMFEEMSNLLKRHGIPHWICSGALIGYHWCGGLLPWDDDVDIQMMATDLYKLRLLKLKIEKYAALHKLSERYLIDINPYHIFREYQYRHRVDVKIIDTKSGFTMDIMAVHPIHGTHGTVWNSKYPKKYEDPSSPYAESSFSADALFPPKPCVFENINTFCPHDVAKQISDDYGKGVLRATKAALFNYSYNADTRKFVPMA